MKRFIIFLASLAVFLFALWNWLPARYGVDYPRTSFFMREGVPDSTLAAAFAERRPEVVLLGNSMLGEGIDEALIDSLLPGRVLKIGLNGAASAVWYLVVKNYVCTQDPPPETVVLFFRDTFLTQPRFRVDGKYRPKVDSYAGPVEARLDRLAYLDGMNPVSYFLHLRFPPWGEREKLRNDIVDPAKFGPPAFLARADSLAVEEAIARTFADSNMNLELLTAAQLKAEEAVGRARTGDFRSDLDGSFLPAMVELLREKGVDLVLVRVKRRRDLAPNSRPADLEAYARRLEDYLAARNVGYLDYTDAGELREEHFGEGDHLNDEGRAIFTRMVAADLQPSAAGRVAR